MADPICFETPRSRSFSRGLTGGPQTREFMVLHESDEDNVYSLVEAAADVSYKGRERKSIDPECLGVDIWLVKVQYGPAVAEEGDLPRDAASFRVTAASVHITQSFETLANIGAGPNLLSGNDLSTGAGAANHVTPDNPLDVTSGTVGMTLVVTGGEGWTPGYYRITAISGGTEWVLDRAPAPVAASGGLWYVPAAATDHKGAIGVDKDSVQGCDTFTGEMEFSLDAARSSLTHDDLRSFRALVGKVTDRDWKGYPAGTVMYLGCEPAGDGGTLPNGAQLQWWSLAHHFRSEENQTDVVIGDITLPLVPAFAYVWAEYAPDVKAGDTRLAVRPIAVHVERTHKGYFNPEILGIP